MGLFFGQAELLRQKAEQLAHDAKSKSRKQGRKAPANLALDWYNTQCGAYGYRDSAVLSG